MHKNIHCRKLSPLCTCRDNSRDNSVFYLQAVLTQRQRPTQNCRVVDHKSLFILRNVVNPHPGTLSFIVV